jgi:hypothetical protein
MYATELLATAMLPSGPAPQIVPTPKGGLQLEWHEPAADLEVEIDPNGQYSLSFEKEGRTEEAQGLASSSEGLNRFISALAS